MTSQTVTGSKEWMTAPIIFQVDTVYVHSNVVKTTDAEGNEVYVGTETTYTYPEWASKQNDATAETDELMLDHEERIILLEVGE